MSNELLEGLPGDPAKAAIIAAKSEIVGVEESRATSESQAGFIVAKKFPRDEGVALNRVMTSCQRKTLAEQAEYAFPKGGSLVTGPSIRLAEVLAQAWGNMLFGIRELQEIEGASMLMAYCYDLETNTRSERIFTVKHERKARGKVTQLTDARDIYEINFNQGARRLRACILQVIPGDVTEMAVEACRATLEATEADASEENIGKMLKAFDELGVTLEMIEVRIGKKAKALTPPEMVALRRIFTSIRDGMSKVDQWFPAESGTTAGLKEKFKKLKKDEEPDEEEKPKKKRKARAKKADKDAPPEAEKTAGAPPEREQPPEAPEPPPGDPTPPEAPPEAPNPPEEHQEEDPGPTELDYSASTLDQPKRPSQWNAQYDGLRGRAIDAGATFDEWHGAVMELLSQMGFESVNEVPVMKRPMLKTALVALVEQLEEQTEVE